MKKCFSAVLLALGMLCSLAPLNVNAEEPTQQTDGNFTYLNYGDHIEITGFAQGNREENDRIYGIPRDQFERGKLAFQTIEIPAEIDGLPVTSIGEWAFVSEQFSDVILPDTLTSIQRCAFAYCPNLTEIEFPESLTSIGNSAFQNCGLKEVHIPETITEFGEGVFYRCRELETAELPDNMTVIPVKLFEWCNSLKNVELPESVTTIGEGAFECCWALESFDIPDTVTTLESCCLAACSHLKEITIPDSVTEIGNSVFANCVNLKRVNLSGNVKDINFGLFSFSGIEEVTFSENVESVDCSLTWCKNLKSVTFLNPDTGIFDNVLSLFNEYDEKGKTYDFGGIIYGYDGSTAQAYAEKYGYTFQSIGETSVSDVAGDMSGDGRISVVDLIQFKKGLLLGKALPQIGDMNGDNVVNVIDLALLKQALLKQK